MTKYNTGLKVRGQSLRGRINSCKENLEVSADFEFSSAL
jgi:hypothetical protein